MKNGSYNDRIYVVAENSDSTYLFRAFSGYLKKQIHLIVNQCNYSSWKYIKLPT